MLIQAIAIVCLFSTLCGACTHKPAQHAGDAQGSARLEALPSLDVADRELTTEMRFARELSQESLALNLPDFAQDTNARRRWTDTALKQWLRDKQSAAEAANQALEAAGRQNGRQRVMASALAGLVFEQTARALLAVPPPTDLPLGLAEIAVFREIMQKNASFCLQTARLAYAACAEKAPGLKGLAHWSAFCLDRAKALPGRTDELGAE